MTVCWPASISMHMTRSCGAKMGVSGLSCLMLRVSIAVIVFLISRNSLMHPADCRA